MNIVNYILKRLLSDQDPEPQMLTSEHSDSIAIQKHILLKIILHLTVSTVLTVFYGFINFRWSSNSPYFFLISTVLFFLLQSIIFTSFFKFTYAPIINFLGHIQLFKNDYKEDLAKPSGKETFHLRLGQLIDLLVHFRESIDREVEVKMKKKQAEIDALQSQINPHLLYNILEAIRGKAIIEGVDEIADMTEALSNYYRYNVSQRGSIVELKDELRSVENYFSIQRYRFGDRFNLQMNLDSEEGALSLKLPKLTIQPIVENAIFHGLEPKIGKGNVIIRTTVTERRLIIHVIDDGIGMEKSKLDEINNRLNNSDDYPDTIEKSQTRGIALINVNQRIKLNFGPNYGLSVFSSPDSGTDIEITVPILETN